MMDFLDPKKALNFLNHATPQNHHNNLEFPAYAPLVLCKHENGLNDHFNSDKIFTDNFHSVLFVYQV